MSNETDPPPSADPGPDPERILREIGQAEPRLGCMGRTVRGGGAIVILGALALLIIYLIDRCVS